jgi:uncharacterized membrane protein YeaQ/YmgE (transglycosylase-associated protein family)
MTLIGLIIFLLIGAVAGWLAGLTMKGGGVGLLGDIVVGIIGSLIGGWLFGRWPPSPGGRIAPRRGFPAPSARRFVSCKPLR